VQSLPLPQRQTPAHALHIDSASQQVPTPSVPSRTPCSSPLPISLSINSEVIDDDSDIEYIETVPSSTTHRPLPALLSQLPSSSTPIDIDIEPERAPKRESCRQHLISVPQGQTAIGAYPFLPHVEDHVPWEFTSHHGSLLLHARNCKGQPLDNDGLCQQCRNLLSSDKFRKLLAHMQEGVICENIPYKYHGLASLAKITQKKEQTIEMYRTRCMNNTQKLLGHV
jgi:hypothetical protein